MPIEIKDAPDGHFDVMQLCEVENREDAFIRFAIKPEVMYPAMAAHIKKVVASGALPGEVMVTNNPDVAPAQAARRYVREGHRLKAFLDMVGKPVSDVPAEAQQKRGDALELCRKWFMRAVAGRVTGGGINLHYLKTEDSERFKLPAGYAEKPLAA